MPTPRTSGLEACALLRLVRGVDGIARPPTRRLTAPFFVLAILVDALDVTAIGRDLTCGIRIRAALVSDLLRDRQSPARGFLILGHRKPRQKVQGGAREEPATPAGLIT